MWMTRIAVVILRMRRSGSGRDACLFFCFFSLGYSTILDFGHSAGALGGNLARSMIICIFLSFLLPFLFIFVYSQSTSALI